MGSVVINLQTYYTKKSDIVDNLTSDDELKPLSAKQGKKLEDTKVSKAQGPEKANLNVVTDANGNIAFNELDLDIYETHESVLEGLDYFLMLLLFQ